MRISISKVVNSQLPSFVREEYPLFSEFLKQYYISDDSERLIQNLDKNIDLDVLFKVENQTILTSQVNFIDKIISVESTYGFPDEYGLIKIDNEIILYESKTETQFLNCARGFSGISEIDNDSLIFEETEFDFHNSGSIVYNLSSLFLQIFAMNIKKRVSPGFENRNLFNDLNKSNFLKNIKSFYTSKGSDESFRILFGALYGKEVEVVKPRDFLISASGAQYRFTKDIVVEVIEGDPYQLLNSTVYQDKTDTIEPAQGTIVEVNKIIRDNKEYFVIGLDFDYNKDSDVSGTTRSEFSIHPKTIATNKSQINSNYIDVDSTIGFSESGQILTENNLNITYTEKTINQFLGCSGIISEIPDGTEIKTSDYIYGFTEDGSQVKMRINGVLGDIDFIEPTLYYNPTELIKIETLGQNSTLFKANNWFFNVSVNYKIKTLELKDSSNISYKVSTFDTNNFVIGDSFTLFASDGTTYNGEVIFVENKNTIIIVGQGLLNTLLTYNIKKNISKVDTRNPEYQYLSSYNSNIQNVYLDYNDNVYVYSNSFPTYYDYPLEIKDFILKVPAGLYKQSEEIRFTSPHGLFTGDAVIYRPVNDSNKILELDVYYVKKINDTIIKLSRSLYNIYNESYVKLDGIISSGFESTLEPLRFNDQFLNKFDIKPQNSLKLLSDPEITFKEEKTEPGTVGILVNGVELSNYKSDDVVFYGGIDSIDVVSGGDGYNIITPPEITISDPVGTGASAFVSVEGSLERIDIIDPGFDYIDTPSISIVGGNGSGAVTVPEMVEFIHSVEFNSEKLVDLTNDIIETFEDHKFRNYEEVIYRTNNQNNIAGLTTNSTYYVKVISSNQVKLYNNIQNASSGINTINLSGIGTGIHALVSTQPKKKLNKIKIVNSGYGYKNKKVKISGISTFSDTLTILNHRYNNGEIVSYYPDSEVISGLSSSKSYYVTVVDENNIKLSGISTVDQPDINYQRKNYIDIISPEFSGNHYLNYPKIEVSINGTIGVSTLSGQDFRAKLQPVFSGQVKEVFIENKGSSYGSADIINFERKPIISIIEPQQAQVTPIIQGGTITNIIINYTGDSYQQVPDVIVTPYQSDIELTPILSDGKLIEIKIINGGKNLDPEKTSVSIVSKESGAKFEPKINSRRINIVERLINTRNISRDDGYIAKSTNSLKYTHLYAPRSLRSSILRQSGNVNVKDLNIRLNREQLSTVHSPLLGWAYDGNPIYGPYGYSNGNFGSVKALKSGYELKSIEKLESENRPPFSIYPIGFFVDDYEFTGNGDLDDHNGRFCITPEYPNGIYAYFCTISDTLADSSSPFFNYYSPIFPYVIGPTFRNKLNAKDYTFEVVGDKLLRNTTPYNLTKNNSIYNYILNPNKIKEENLEIEKTNTGKINNIKILNPGSNYKVNDTINFSDNGYAKVNSISGVAVSSIGVAYTSIYNVEVLPYKNNFIGISSQPHGINYTQISSFNSFYEKNKKVTLSPFINSLLLTSKVEPVSQTGIITYFNISSILEFPLKENDVFTINNEEIKILNIDNSLSRIRVEREYNGTSGITTHEVNSVLFEKSRKFTFEIGLSTTYNFKENKEFYFNPAESVGLGTANEYRLIFNNPGTGLTTLTIPTKTIYIKNHELTSGDSIFYDSNGGESIEVSNAGIGSTALSSFSELFVTKIESNLIGLSTQRSGVGSTDKVLYFTGIGTGNNHSFKTNYSNTLIGDITKNIVTVSTATTHGLSLLDTVKVSVNSGIQTSYKVYYDEESRRICFDKKYVESVNLINNTITITDHKFKNGEKVIYVSDSEIGGLESGKLYYVIYINKDSFKLSFCHYSCLSNMSGEFDLTSSGTGYFYKVNPKIEITRDQDIIFDTSDSSLSFKYGELDYSAFELKLFKTKHFADEYNTYDLQKSGVVGITSTSNYKLITRNLPDKIFYKFIPINTTIIPDIKNEIYFDDYSQESGLIERINSKYTGTHSIVGVSSTSFSYLLESYPEEKYYNFTDADISYSTNSTSVSGPIEEIKVISSKISSSIPTIKNITTTNGVNGIFKLESNDIGSISKVKKLDIGFGYNRDYTIRPKLILPQVIEVVPTYKLKSVGIQTRGIGYSYAPSLIVVDNTNNFLYSNIKLDYQLENNKIDIIENNDLLISKNIKIVATNNDNGFEIDTISYNQIQQEVTVKLKTGFNNILDFPFTEGSNVFIENVPKLNLNVIGFNSKDYNYSTFKITSSTPNIGGVGATFVYSLSEFVGSNTTLSQVDTSFTSGFAIPETYFPTFDIQIKNNEFIKDENVKFCFGESGKVVSWNPENNQLKIFTDVKLNPGNMIYGETSKNYTVISSVTSSSAFIDIKLSSNLSKGWKDNKGFLNDPLQRIHDSNYYQYFSYDIKSEVDYSDWSDTVDSLNHTSGFKKFGNLLINSQQSNVGLRTSQDLGDVKSDNDLYSELNVNCYNDFDLVTENYFYIDNNLKSNEVYFKSRRLQNYIESISNKVILIDDISDKFKPVEIIDDAIVDVFNKFDFRFKKYILHILDKLNPFYSEGLIVHVLHNDNVVGISQYAINESITELGYFDAEIDGFNINLLFYPIIKSNKIYSVNSFSYNISDSISGVGSTSLGDIATLSSYSTTGIGTTVIAGISSDKTASKIMVLYSDLTNNNFYSDEINYVHDGVNIIYNNYSGLNLGLVSGIGTYGLFYNGSNIDVILYPNQNTLYDVNCFSIEISNTSSVIEGESYLSGNKLESNLTGVSTTGSPIKTLIYDHDDNYTSGLHQITITDTDNNFISYYEFFTVLNSSTQDIYSVNFGNLHTKNEFGSIEVEYSLINGNLEIYFTPFNDINYQSRVFSTLVSKYRRSETLEI